MRRISLILTALVLVALAAWFLSRPRGPQAVFLIVVDTLRPDRLSCYGPEGPTTPAIDGLARSGTLFTNAQSAASWTIPSMAAMMTSLFPSELGLVERPLDPPRPLAWRDRRDQTVERLSEDAVTLAELLRDRGLHTAAFVNQPAINARDGFNQGFDEWFVPTTTGTVVPLEFKRDGFDREGTSWGSQPRGDLAVVDGFIDWLRKNASERMFVWVHLVSPHRPYSPPRAYRRGAHRAPMEQYDGEVGYVDELTGRLVAAIDSNVGLENAMIVFVSDHGEEFGEHGMYEHGHSLHREIMWVPLILAGHGVPSGRRIDTYVRTVDIAPTVLDYLGYAKKTPSEMVGASLFPMLEAGGQDRVVFAEGVLYGSTEKALIENGYKLMVDDQEPLPRLYDTTGDTAELHDLASTQGENAEALARHIEVIREETATYRDAHLHDLADSLVTPAERERIRRAMRALGYIND